MNSRLSKIFFFITFVIILLSMQFCKSSATMITDTSDKPVSYEKDISPIMKLKCTPCHFPEHGRKEMLDTYAATKEHIEDILHRVQLPETDKKFMPFKSKREPLTKEEIELFKKWAAQSMPQ